MAIRVTVERMENLLEAIDESAGVLEDVRSAIDEWLAAQDSDADERRDARQELDRQLVELVALTARLK